MLESVFRPICERRRSTVHEVQLTIVRTKWFLGRLLPLYGAILPLIMINTCSSGENMISL